MRVALLGFYCTYVFSQSSVIVLARGLGDALAFEFEEDDFTHADVIRRDFDVFVGFDVL